MSETTNKIITNAGTQAEVIEELLNLVRLHEEQITELRARVQALEPKPFILCGNQVDTDATPEPAQEVFEVGDRVRYDEGLKTPNHAPEYGYVTKIHDDKYWAEIHFDGEKYVRHTCSTPVINLTKLANAADAHVFHAGDKITKDGSNRGTILQTGFGLASGLSEAQVRWEHNNILTWVYCDKIHLIERA